MDKENADYARTVQDIQEHLTDRALPLFLPIGQESAFKGLVNVLTGKAYTYKADGSRDFTEGEIPAEMADNVAAAREALVERVVEVDDEAMMRYLEGEEIGQDEAFSLLRKAVREARVFPVLPGSGTANVGVFQFLDTVCDVLPSPVEMPPRPAFHGDEEVQIKPDPEGIFNGMCFKVMVDPYVGKLSFIRLSPVPTTLTIQSITSRRTRRNASRP